jgi:hypothetical protein
LGCSSVTRGSLSSNAQIESREGAFDRSLSEPFGLRAERKQSGDPLHHLTEPPPLGIVERHAQVPGSTWRQRIDLVSNGLEP